jgi:hypothetical protein
MSHIDETVDPIILKPPLCQPYDDLASLYLARQDKCDPEPPEPKRNAVCGSKYTNTDGCASEIRRAYELKTYRNRRKAIADGAVITHKGPCGVCSNHQDLAVYLTPGLLDAVSAHCGLLFVDFSKPTLPLRIDYDDAFKDVKKCYNDKIIELAPNMGLALTPDCAHVWASNNLKTAVSCWEQSCTKWEADPDPVDDCCKTAIEGNPDLGIPPWEPNNFTTCEINGCLKCDEEKSGEVFKKYAGRTRRNSGIIGPVIKRPCGSIANLKQDPCANPKKCKT